jgi:hypothetical protein
MSWSIVILRLDLISFRLFNMWASSTLIIEIVNGVIYLNLWLLHILPINWVWILFRRWVEAFTDPRVRILAQGHICFIFTVISVKFIRFSILYLRIRITMIHIKSGEKTLILLFSLGWVQMFRWFRSVVSSIKKICNTLLIFKRVIEFHQGFLLLLLSFGSFLANSSILLLCPPNYI